MTNLVQFPGLIFSFQPRLREAIGVFESRTMKRCINYIGIIHQIIGGRAKFIRQCI